VVKIPKLKGGHRQLGIPTVKDRLIQQAILQVLSPRYERIFSEYSYGFRPGGRLMNQRIDNDLELNEQTVTKPSQPSKPSSYQTIQPSSHADSFSSSVPSNHLALQPPPLLQLLNRRRLRQNTKLMHRRSL
jgi:hypothetical protein